MAFQVSPGVFVNEVDQTNIVPASSTSVGAFAGHFNWGPVEQLVNVSSEKELALYFGAPNKSQATRSFLTGASFLKYSNSLRVSRALGLGATNAADANATQIKNAEHFDTLTGLGFIFSAKYPGAIGNSLTVSYAHVAGASDFNYTGWPYANFFDAAPNQSLTAESVGLDTNDEIHLVVIDSLGYFSGTPGTLLERYEGLSLGTNAKNDNGASIYYKDVINSTSSYIVVESLDGTFAQADTEITVDSEFAVIGASVSTESYANVPFNLEVSTTVTYSGGAQETTITTEDKTVKIKSGVSGAIGNNVRLNVRTVDILDAPIKAGYAFIDYGVPLTGDTINVTTDGIVTNSFVMDTDFTTITELAALLVGTTLFSTVTEVGNFITIESTDAVNVFGLTLDVGNTGTLTVSAETFTDVLAVDSLSYLDATLDLVQTDQGYITYDVTVATQTNVDVLETDVTLADIIREIEYRAVQANDVDLQDLTFFIGTDEVVVTDSLASMKLDIEDITPYTVTGQIRLEVIPFIGGEVVTYNLNTLLNTYVLTDGVDGSFTGNGTATALELFADKETVEFDLIFAEVFNDDIEQDIIDVALYTLINARKDVVGFVSAPIDIATVSSADQKFNAVIDKFDSGTFSSTSFVVFDETPVYTYNKYADKFIWIPAAGHVAGLCANADFVADPWFSPAGHNRGQLKGVTKIAFNPNKTQRDELYKKRINSIVAIPGEGIILLGDKTGLAKPSAFDRINVRRLFNVLERAISKAAKFQLFEFNDEFTRSSFKNTIEPFLRDVQGRRGIIEFKVVCDETNNTDEVIDANEFVGDIFIKPARSINTIQLNFIATRTGVDFKEIVGG
jgi:hypothetical protein